MGISVNRHCHSIGWKEERWMKFQRVKKELITNESPKGHPAPITRRSTPRFDIKNAWKRAKFRRRKRKILFQNKSDDMEIIQSLMPEVVKNFGEHKLKGEFIAFLKLVAADCIPMDKCTCLWVFLRNLFRNFVNVLLKFKGYDKRKTAFVRLNVGGTWGRTFINLLYKQIMTLQ